MLRGENIICGTSSTGTGTLTCAACPVPPGGVDLYAWLTSTGLNFVNGNAVLVSYTLIEYTDSTFATAKQSEQGIGTLTLGASLTASTLARTTVQSKQTTENTTGVYAGNAPTAISIGTAANTLIFIGAKAADLPAFSPYYETSLGDNLGVMPPNVFSSTDNLDMTITALTDYYTPFSWWVPMLVKKCSVRVATSYSGGTSNAYGRIYDINSSGRPGKLLIDFGLIGSSNASLNSTGNKSSAAHASGFMLMPGDYIFDFVANYSGGSGTPLMFSGDTTGSRTGGGYIRPARLGTTNMNPYATATATSGTAGAAPDPANTTSYAGVTAANVQDICFTLAPS